MKAHAAGLSGLFARPLLTQHRFASAARLLLQRGANRQSGHSPVSILPEPKPHFRCNQLRHLRRGQTSLILMQHLSSFQTSQRDDRITAVQHNFPKAVIQYGLTKQNLGRL
jgi:hypothetical protein